MLARTRTRTNPVFRPDELAQLIGAERAERALTEPDNADFLTWNVFSTLETHRDEPWLAHRLQSFGGSQLTAPLRLALFTGAASEPLLAPSAGYVAAVRERASTHGGDDRKLSDFLAPVEVPVRIESPDVLCLVDTTTHGTPLGRGGRDRVVELVDSGLEHARRLGKTLAVAVVYRSATPAASQLSARIRQLRDPGKLAAEMPHRRTVPPVVLREMTWQQLLQVWVTEQRYLDLGGLPVRRFIEHCRERRLLQ